MERRNVVSKKSKNEHDIVNTICSDNWEVGISFDVCFCKEKEKRKIKTNGCRNGDGMTKTRG